jgi:tRNA(Ile2)-agmatinylcytidine synthase
LEFIWIGVDDTDSRHGGCTTYVACAIIEKLVANGFDIIGFPRLVRLNPNIPWKTRGNGAISIQVGKGTGDKTNIGEIGNKDIFCYSNMSSGKVDGKRVKEIVEQIIMEHSRLNDENTNSGFVILDEQPDLEMYYKTVRGIVTIDKVELLLESLNAIYKGYKNRRGLIGATASVSWRPEDDETYEIISYREKKKWGTKRYVDDASTKKMDETCSSTFDNYDYVNKHNRLVPSSPCPILFGIRGDDAEELVSARDIIKSEKVNSWMLFETNQGTDDHLQRKKIGDIQPYLSVITGGKIVKNPYTIEGGHVIFTIKDSTGTIDCAAYEPTKQFRNKIRELCTGDLVDVYGGIREKPLTINIEKIRVKRLKKQFIKVENPICPNCGKHMKSKGTGQGFKCVKCGTKSNKTIIKEKKREINIDFYEVPVCARRHLSKPLKRMMEP